MIFFRLPTTILLCLLFLKGQAQTDNRATYKLHIKKIDKPIQLDGELLEAEWQRAEVTTPFLNQWPLDTGRAAVQTEVRILYDNNFIYVGITCHDYHNKHVIRTLKRDSPDEYFGSDGIAIVLDPINRRTNGFFFGVNARGAQMEGLVQINGAQTTLDENWDNKWRTAVSQGNNKWYVEMAIPFNSLRYENGNSEWGLNFVRNDMKGNKYYSWAPVPVNLNTIDLGYNGALVWDEPPPVDRGNISLIPFALGKATKDFENGTDLKATANAGMDAKFAITSSLNLDVTVNSDFSNAEVDRQVTNLTRFSLFFPERRNFFLENSDLFSSFGYRFIRPFFSRSIGLLNGQPIPILAGIRLSGNLTDNTRIGMMSVQTRTDNGIASQNYSVAAFQHRLFGRSSLKGMFVNREHTDNAISAEERGEYNRIGALEFNYLSVNGKWGADVRHHQTFSPMASADKGFSSLVLRHNSKNLELTTGFYDIDENYIADTGFAPRNLNYDAANDTTIRRGFKHAHYVAVYNFFPAKGPLNVHGPRHLLDQYFNDDWSQNEQNIFFGYFFGFKNQSIGELNVRLNQVNLPFSTLIVGEVPFAPAHYTFNRYGIFYNLDPRKALSGGLDIGYGSFYTGTNFDLELRTNYRATPWGNFSITYNLNKIELPTPYQAETLHLIGPRMEISFSNNMFWTTFLQYNTQAENFNINSRFQWRYKPMSDFFIVYSDNYATTNLNVKNRGIVFKLTYWLNL